MLIWFPKIPEGVRGSISLTIVIDFPKIPEGYLSKCGMCYASSDFDETRRSIDSRVDQPYDGMVMLTIARRRLHVSSRDLSTRRASAGFFRRHEAGALCTTSQYEARNLKGWTIVIRKAFLSDQPRLAEKTLSLLEKQLDQIVEKVPAEAVAKLRSVRIWVEENDPHHPCMAYHPAKGWLREHGMNPAKARCVEIANGAISWIGRGTSPGWFYTSLLMRITISSCWTATRMREWPRLFVRRRAQELREGAVFRRFGEASVRPEQSDGILRGGLRGVFRQKRLLPVRPGRAGQA